MVSENMYAVSLQGSVKRK